jgi:hypothetical protein
MHCCRLIIFVCHFGNLRLLLFSLKVAEGSDSRVVEDCSQGNVRSVEPMLDAGEDGNECEVEDDRDTIRYVTLLRKARQVVDLFFQ